MLDLTGENRKIFKFLIWYIIMVVDSLSIEVYEYIYIYMNDGLIEKSELFMGNIMDNISPVKRGLELGVAL